MLVLSKQTPKIHNANVVAYWLVFSVLLLFVVPQKGFAQSSKFIVVLDPGHGGKDSGALGRGLKEKDLVLAVALKTGEILEANHKDIKVIYTRKKDEFVELRKRGEIANKVDANLFVSIHANSASESASGTETFVLGVHGNESNLAVAKKENDVILLEENYEKHYNYNPKNPESLIGLTLMQEDFLDYSIRMAKLIENNFDKTGKTKTRGTKQAGFVVLHQTYMPSVLTEIGFVSNKKEAQYLGSKNGQKTIAKAIANSIVKYKKELDKAKASVVPITIGNDKPIFKVQIAASTKNLETKSYNFKKLSPISKDKSGNVYKYYYGETSNIDQAKILQKKAEQKGYKGAFIIAFKNGKRMSVKEALKSE